MPQCGGGEVDVLQCGGGEVDVPQCGGGEVGVPQCGGGEVGVPQCGGEVDASRRAVRGSWPAARGGVVAARGAAWPPLAALEGDVDATSAAVRASASAGGRRDGGDGGAEEEERGGTKAAAAVTPTGRGGGVEGADTIDNRRGPARRGTKHRGSIVWVDYFCLRQLRNDFKPEQIAELIRETGAVYVKIDGAATGCSYPTRSFCVLETSSAIEGDAILMIETPDDGPLGGVDPCS